MSTSRGSNVAVGQPTLLGSLEEQRGDDNRHEKDHAQGLEGAEDTERRDEQRCQHRREHGGTGGRGGQGDARRQALLIDKPLLTRGEGWVVAKAVTDSGHEREPQVELPRSSYGTAHEPTHAVADSGCNHDVARADLIGDATGKDARDCHDGLKHGECPGKGAGPIGVDSQKVLAHHGVERNRADEEHGHARSSENRAAAFV